MAKVSVDELERFTRVTAGEFNWDDRAHTGGVLADWLEDVIAAASARVTTDVGATNYADTTTATTAMIKQAELYLSVSMVLERRLMILTSRPEEAPPEEYIDTTRLSDMIQSFRSQYEEWVAPWRVNDKTQRGTAFAMDVTGIDETEEDDYDFMDYGDLE